MMEVSTPAANMLCTPIRSAKLRLSLFFGFCVCVVCRSTSIMSLSDAAIAPFRCLSSCSSNKVSRNASHRRRTALIRISMPPMSKGRNRGTKSPGMNKPFRFKVAIFRS